MRLTVGPLPAAIYWRRRAVVLVGITAVVLVISYACSGPEGSAADPQAGATTSATTASDTSSPSVRAEAAVSAAATTTAVETPTDTVTASGGCSDAQMSVTASAAVSQVPGGQPLDLTITIKNISTHACSRDLGADVQELRLVDQKTIIWSSDDCNPNTGHDQRVLSAGKQLSFTLRWNGRRTRTGTGAVTCSPALLPEPGVYDVVARLDQILSAPFVLQIMS